MTPVEQVSVNFTYNYRALPQAVRCGSLDGVPDVPSVPGCSNGLRGSVLHDQLTKILTTFSSNVEFVWELMRFDSNLLDFAVLQHLESLQNRLKNVHGLDNPRFDVENTFSMLRNIRSNQSPRKHYEEMLNRCNVLLVSYFSSAVADIFLAGVAEAVRSGSRSDILREEISIKLSEAREIGPELVDCAGELLLLASHSEIKLQNMQSVAKAFADYFGYQRQQHEVVNDIIMSHACRM